MLIDYTQPDEETPGEWKMVEVSSHHGRCSTGFCPRQTTLMILTLCWQACKDCKVCIVTKSQKLSSGALRFMTSIWALSDDRSTRLQQKCAAPYILVSHASWLTDNSGGWRRSNTVYSLGKHKEGGSTGAHRAQIPQYHDGCKAS